ncbi:TerB family tellurite resistance protein [Synechocystis sp. FACHB-383]|uniref:tellurite resistance TerB family protein n=1 Tax=Synechocystis sp. FACHB-383 TaxID=2692864 RepID=UPI00168A0D54|nr:TerB family tellurite resistance protein [Synechocystis sp. FACHB-383]MBD2652823.1 TerB family tellurite resistance protein [Synechocystis sp. FACHB-383]
MTKTAKTKQLLKILIGAAWLDGVIQVEERQYLRRLAAEYKVENDPELQALLSELKSVEAPQCYAWVNEYLGDYPSEEEYSELLEALSGLLYSDGDIQTQEAQLLASLQESDPGHGPPKSSLDKFLGKVQRLYRRALQKAS